MYPVTSPPPPPLRTWCQKKRKEKEKDFQLSGFYFMNKRPLSWVSVELYKQGLSVRYYLFIYLFGLYESRAGWGGRGSGACFCDVWPAYVRDKKRKKVGKKRKKKKTEYTPAVRLYPAPAIRIPFSRVCFIYRRAKRIDTSRKYGGAPSAILCVYVCLGYTHV